MQEWHNCGREGLAHDLLSTFLRQSKLDVHQIFERRGKFSEINRSGYLKRLFGRKDFRTIIGRVKMEGKPSQNLVAGLVELVEDLLAIGDAVKSYRKDCTNLTRRIKVLALLFEELGETGTALPPAADSPCRDIQTALLQARDLLQECRDNSQFVLILDRERIALSFRRLTSDMSRALDELPLGSLDVSDEVHEQVELVRAQLKRAKVRVDLQDEDVLDLQDEDLFVSVNELLKKEADGLDGDHALLQTLAEKLQLQTEISWRQELLALEKRRDRATSPSEEEGLDHLINVLKNVQVKVEDGKETEAFVDAWRAEKASSSRGSESSPRGVPLIPDDFKCPISLELMNDPVTVATGQTYERSCIQRWLDSGRKTCPKTQLHLSHLLLTPNYVLQRLIAQWCEANGLAVPKNGSVGKMNGSGNYLSGTCGDEVQVGSLLIQLASDELDVQRSAAAELRLLAKKSAENRLCIAESGAIPILVSLLSTSDLKTQEHAVTALLNISILEDNKRAIVNAGAIDPIVEVLKHGIMEARENSAATLFSLSALDEHKVTIGSSGAIPALVVLLQEGQNRGRKDAATALFTLCIYQGNKAKAVRTGIVPPLMDLLLDTSSGMVDEALAILAVLATHHEGRFAIGRANAVPVLVDMITNGSPRNKENGASVLLALCTSNRNHRAAARHLDAAVPVAELLQSGTSRAKRKALELLQHLNEQESLSTTCGKPC